MPKQSSYASYTFSRSISIRNLPVSVFASVMGIAGLSIAWHQASVMYGVSPWVAQTVGAVAVAIFGLLTTAYGLKALLHPEAVISEYQHPIAGNFFGTIAISVLLVSAVVAPQSQQLAELIWTVGTVITFGIGYAIASRLLRGNMEIKHVVPACFIPGVATLDIAVTGGSMPMAWAHEVNLLAMAVGSVLALLFFVLIMSRLIQHEPLPLGLTPSLLIVMAPFEVGFLAYTNTLQQIDTFSALLFYFGLFLFLILAPKVFRKGIPFSAAWWAVSFPMAALTIAALKYAMFVQAWPIEALALLLLIMLSVTIMVLFIKTLVILVNGELLAER